MSATKLNVQWMESESDQPMAIPSGQAVSLVRVGVSPGERRCPSCNSLVYARRHKWCGACSQTLPASCLFSADEAKRVDALLKTEHERHREWLKKAAGG
jgi:hypothetical protein